MKQYVGLIRDHSASMKHLANAAMQDYNDNIHSLKTEAGRVGMTTIVSVLKCGCGVSGTIEKELLNVDISNVYPVYGYATDGYSTPLFDSVGQMIQIMGRNDLTDNDPTRSYLIVATTDGENNRNYQWYASNLSAEIKRLQATDRWTFVFRVPFGYKKDLVKLLGLHEGNVIEWDQTQKGMEISTHSTQAGYGNYFSVRASGAGSTRSFFVDTTNIETKDLKVNLIDISGKVHILYVDNLNHRIMIRDFVETKMKYTNPNHQYVLGSAYYELTKTETLQPQKDIIVWDKNNGHMYQGQSAARHLLNLPQTGDIKIVPGNIGDKKIFIQSTSVNRKLMAGTNVLIYNR